MKQYIKSLQNQRIKDRAKLLTKKGRDKEALFLVEGMHMVQEAYQANCLKEVYQIDEEVLFDIDTFICSQDVLNKLSSQKSNTKIIGVCEKRDFQSITPNKTIILDDVQDPGNVGTILRSAYSFGYDQVILSKHCADIYNPKTLQSSQGAIFHIPCSIQKIDTVIEQCQANNIYVYATALHHQHIHLADVKPPKKFAIIFGNEGQGIHPQYIESADSVVQIEMKNFESLNVAMAASIMMYTLQFND